MTVVTPWPPGLFRWTCGAPIKLSRSSISAFPMNHAFPSLLWELPLICEATQASLGQAPIRSDKSSSWKTGTSLGQGHRFRWRLMVHTEALIHSVILSLFLHHRCMWNGKSAEDKYGSRNFIDLLPALGGRRQPRGSGCLAGRITERNKRYEESINWLIFVYWLLFKLFSGRGNLANRVIVGIASVCSFRGPDQSEIAV